MAGPPSTQPGRAFAWSHGRFGGTCLTEINRGFEFERGDPNLDTREQQRETRRRDARPNLKAGIDIARLLWTPFRRHWALTSDNCAKFENSAQYSRDSSAARLDNLTARRVPPD
jgi:hypothetical protein